MAHLDVRRDAVAGLVRRTVPVTEALDRLRAFPWDSDEELEILRVEDVAGLLEDFLAGRVSHREVLEWADAVEAREDLGRDPERAGWLGQALAELANPALFGPATEVAARILSALREGGTTC